MKVKCVDYNIKQYDIWKKKMTANKKICTYQKNHILKFWKSILNFGSNWYGFNFTTVYKRMTDFTNPNERKKEIQFYTLDEFKLFLSGEDDLRYRCIWQTLFYCDLRCGEDIFRIIPSDCDTKYVIKGILDNKTVYYKKTTNEHLWGSEWDVPNFVETIKEATLYDSTGIAEEVCANIDFGNFKIYPVCPSCHEEYKGYPSISRYDNKTKICDKCGLLEALWDFFEHEKKTTDL